MVKLRRGFVKECEEYATAFRQELRLARHDPICPFALADLLDVSVNGISSHPLIDEETKRFMAGTGKSMFFAMTLCDGVYREILHNDYQHPNRVRSDIMHEIAHIVLRHPPHPPFIGESCRSFNATLEQEANDLGFTLLVPKHAALHAVTSFSNRRLAALHYGVSQELLDYRIRKADAVRWAQNKAA